MRACGTEEVVLIITYGLKSIVAAIKNAYPQA
ncbi:hypothetical protein [Paenibacillus sp. 481]